MNLKEIQELIKILGANEITELNLQVEGVQLNIKKAATAQAKPAETKSVEKGSVVVNTNLIPVVSPMVGTFYRSSAPDAPPYVEVGATVQVGQPVCIVEALKLKHEIATEVAGKTVEILVENGQTVMYGQTLFLIEKQ